MAMMYWNMEAYLVQDNLAMYDYNELWISNMTINIPDIKVLILDVLLHMTPKAWLRSQLLEKLTKHSIRLVSLPLQSNLSIYNG